MLACCELILGGVGYGKGRTLVQVSLQDLNVLILSLQNWCVAGLVLLSALAHLSAFLNILT